MAAVFGQPVGIGMATFIAIVKRDGDVGYTASFPDFPSCAVAAPTIEHVIARAREALSLHIERLLEANHRICDPTAADAIERGDALLLAAVEVPDDLRIAHIDLAIPALSLARIDAFARRHCLTHAALFVEAVNRWAMQETSPRDRRGSAPDGPTLFDLANPLELRVEPIAATIDPQDDAGTREGEASDERDVEAKVDDITAELVRLLEEGGAPAKTQEVQDESPISAVRKAE
jgi:predicted RNase H-like HicB family nuclease